MDTTTRLAVGVIFARLTKGELVDWLIAHGTIYPNRAGLLRWSKDCLVSSAIDTVERSATREAVTS